MTKIAELCTLDLACCELNCDGELFVGDSVQLQATVESLLPDFDSGVFRISKYGDLSTPAFEIGAAEVSGPPDSYQGDWVPTSPGWHVVRLVLTLTTGQHSFNQKLLYVAL